MEPITPQRNIRVNTSAQTGNESKEDQFDLRTNAASNQRTLTREARRAIIEQRTIMRTMVTPLRQNRSPTASRYLKQQKTTTSTKNTRHRKPTAKQQSMFKIYKTSQEETKTNEFKNTFNLNETSLNKPSKQEMQLDEHGNFMPVTC